MHAATAYVRLAVGSGRAAAAAVAGADARLLRFGIAASLGLVQGRSGNEVLDNGAVDDELVGGPLRARGGGLGNESLQDRVLQTDRSQGSAGSARLVGLVAARGRRGGGDAQTRPRADGEAPGEGRGGGGGTYDDGRVPALNLGVLVELGAANSALAGLEHAAKNSQQTALDGARRRARHTSVAICLRRVVLTGGCDASWLSVGGGAADGREAAGIRWWSAMP